MMQRMGSMACKHECPLCACTHARACACMCLFCWFRPRCGRHYRPGGGWWLHWRRHGTSRTHARRCSSRYRREGSGGESLWGGGGAQAAAGSAVDGSLRGSCACMNVGAQVHQTRTQTQCKQQHTHTRTYTHAGTQFDAGRALLSPEICRCDDAHHSFWTRRWEWPGDGSLLLLRASMLCDARAHKQVHSSL